ncbi:hypothetical protein RQP46_004325 [Phenoliferia psychrophenolica]
MRVLITGASGLLGRAVLREFKQAGHDVTGTAFTRTGEGLVQVDLQDKDALEKLVNEVKPQVVVHCAAERRPDVAEKNPSAVHKLNVDLPAHLSLLSRSPTTPFFLIYISTDYVFDGHARESGYEPSDAVGPTNLYGQTKEEGEREILKGIQLHNARGTVLRVPVLYGEVERNDESAINILLDITRQAAKGEKKKMDHWAIRYPTNVADVARVLLSISTLSLIPSSTSIPQILHFSTQEPYTKYDMCLVLSQLHSPPLAIEMEAVTDGPKEGETVRPRDCHLANTELEKLGVETHGVKFVEWWKDWLAREKASVK